jgi:hypothetical protein
LKGNRFSDTADIQGHAMTNLWSIPEEEFQKCFEQWKHRFTKCTGASSLFNLVQETQSEQCPCDQKNK